MSTQNIDKHVDSLASGVRGVWGSAAGMWRTAAQEVAATLEEGARDVSSLHAVRAAQGCVL